MKLAGEPYAPREPGRCAPRGRRDGAAGADALPAPHRRREHRARARARRRAGLRAARARRAAIAERALGARRRRRSAIPLDARARHARASPISSSSRSRARSRRGAATQRSARLGCSSSTSRPSSLGHDDADRLFARVEGAPGSRASRSSSSPISSRDVRAHADRYTVLRDGKVHGDGRSEDDRRPSRSSARCSVASSSGARRGRCREGRRRLRGRGPGEARCSSRSRALAERRTPREASFVLRRGEILGIAGLVGSGRTELLRAIARARSRSKSGEVDRARAARASGCSARIAAARGSCSVARSRTTSRSRRAARSSSMPTRRPRRGRAVDRRARRCARAVPTQRVGELSGGNQQKVQIARLLREDFDVLLVDEPTRGIDVASKAQVLELVARARARRARGSSSSRASSTSSSRRAIASRSCAAASSAPAVPASEWDEQKLLLEAAS